MGWGCGWNGSVGLVLGGREDEYEGFTGGKGRIMWCICGDEEACLMLLLEGKITYWVVNTRSCLCVSTITIAPTSCAFSCAFLLLIP